MSKRKKPFVIAIAAVSGGGKTTVVQQLQHKLPHAKALFFDHLILKDHQTPVNGWSKVQTMISGT